MTQTRENPSIPSSSDEVPDFPVAPGVATTDIEPVPSSTPTETITDVIFDFGNVLIQWDPKAALISRYSDRLIDRFLTEETSGFWSTNRLADAGLSPHDAIERMRSLHGDLVADMMTYYLDNFSDALPGLIPGARQLVLDLKAAGIGVYGLSNWSSANFDLVWDRFSLLHELDDKVISGFVGLAKPDPAIFEKAVDQFGVSPASSVFIDDAPHNVLAAQKLGINAIMQTSPQFVRSELIRMGIDIPEVLS